MDREFPRRLAALLRTRQLGRSCTWRQTTASTMDDARAGLAQGVPHGAIFGAARQTAGRGRMGRRFVSPPGGLYFTLVLAPEGALEDAWRVGFAAALAARTALLRCGSPPVWFDWPNDLVIDGRKVGGLMAELITPAGSTPAQARLLLGVGLNLGVDPAEVDPEAAGPAGAIPPLAVPDPPAAVTAVFLHALEELLPRCASGEGWADVVQSVREATPACRGGPVRLRLPGGEVREGIGLDILDDGALLVRLPDGSTEAFRYGERILL